MQMRIAMLAALVYCGYSPLLHAQDATKVDAKHYSVVSENAQVRILKVHYGAHEKSIMHSHPATVAVPERRQGQVHIPGRQVAGLCGQDR